MKPLHFTVDAALLRELGERLIGQPHIALGELIKNAYDADASTCQVTLTSDTIEVVDDGHGMTFEEFRDYWMRIGTTHKVQERTSSRLGRSLTGSKGVGRLAAQFLADKLVVETTPATAPATRLRAEVDWTAAVSGQEITSVQVPVSVAEKPSLYAAGHPHGTRLILSGLKDSWGAEELKALGRDLWRLRSPFRLRTSETARGPEDFDIQIEAPAIAGAREAFDEAMTNVFENWRARIRGRLERGRSGGEALVTVEFKENYPKGSKAAAVYRENVALPIDPEAGETNESLLDRAEFEVLVFNLSGRQPNGISVGDLRDYLAQWGNVAVYDAGFRLPYYGSGRDPTGQDWLRLAIDQGRRITVSELLPDRLRNADQRYMLDLPAPGRIFGAVEINTNHEARAAEAVEAAPDEWLQINPGRDRLQDNPAFHQLHQLVRYALDYYANRYRARAAKLDEEKRASEPATTKQKRALQVLASHESSIPKAVYREVRKEVQEALKATEAEEEALDRRAALLAPVRARVRRERRTQVHCHRGTGLGARDREDDRSTAGRHGPLHRSGADVRHHL